ncbi:MAG TPA: DcrB-related protein [Bacteroidota bacterium]|nr:DcrB-related protein [Bacteroidota bacterium]
MNLRIGIMFALAIVLSATAFAGEPDYTIKAPDGWKKRTTSSVPEHYMKNGVSMMLTIDSAPPQAKTLDAYVEFAKQQLETAFKNVQFEPVTKLTINGNDARELKYTGEVSGMKMKYDVVYIAKLPKVYTMTAGGLATTFDAMKAEYAAFFNSFKFK